MVQVKIRLLDLVYFQWKGGLYLQSSEWQNSLLKRSSYIQVLQSLGQSNLTQSLRLTLPCSFYWCSILQGPLIHLLLWWHLQQNCTLSLSTSKSRISWRVSTCSEAVNSVVVLLLLQVVLLGSFVLQSWFRFFVLFLALFKTLINGTVHD